MNTDWQVSTRPTSPVSQSRRPKLGQHFLTDPSYQRNILEALRLPPGRREDLVIEIGAGRGAMTEPLAERAKRVIAIEIDSVLAERLKKKVYQESRIEILHADILSTKIAELCRRAGCEQCFIFGNLPYYISSPILHHLFNSWTSIRQMALLLQLEVATRLTASPGTRAYGYLSVLAQVYSQPRVVLRLPPGAFSPPPKVYSALVDFEVRPELPEELQGTQGGAVSARAMRYAPGQVTSLLPSRESLCIPKFMEFVKGCFAQKRKNLLNNLARTFSRGQVQQELARLSLPSTLRAEELTVRQFATLYRQLETTGRGEPPHLEEKKIC